MVKPKMIWTDEKNFLKQIKDKDKFGVFLDMGVGKTSLLLALLNEKLFEGNKKILIITPKKVSLSTWQNEIDKFKNFHYMKSVLHLLDRKPEKRIEYLKEEKEYQIDIASSGIVPWLAGKYVEKIAKKSKKKRKEFVPNKYTPKYDLIIIDECSQFKDTTTLRFRMLKKILAKRIFLLSGTPFSNVKRNVVERVDKKTGKKKKIIYYSNVDELYYIFYLLDIYRNSLTDFRADFLYSLPWDKYNYYASEKVYKKLTEALEKYCIREKAKLDIDLIEYIIECKVDEKHMKTMIDEYYVETNNLEEVTAANKAVMINKCLQVANGFIYDSDVEPKKMIRLNTYKFDKLKTLLSLYDDNFIICCDFQEDREFLLKNLKGSRTYETKEDEADWNAGKIKYFILSPKSEKYGLNLQFGGNRIVFFGLVWSAESVLQFIKRLYRRGQTRDVYVYYLLAINSYDRYVYETVKTKSDVLDEFISFTKSLKF